MYPDCINQITQHPPIDLACYLLDQVITTGPTSTCPNQDMTPSRLTGHKLISSVLARRISTGPAKITYNTTPDCFACSSPSSYGYCASLEDADANGKCTMQRG